MSWFDPQYTELYGSEPSLSDLLPPSPASTISSNVQTEHGFPSDQFRPLNFHEWVVALNAIWQKYRVEADRVYDLGVIELTNREQKAYPYPRTGLIDIRGDQPREPYSPKEFSSMFQSKFFKISTTTEELFDPNSAPRIRQRYWEAKHYFEWVAGTGTTTIADGYLGYGHRGLAIKATHRGPGQEHPRDYVIKVDHRSWESAAIRREKKALKHVLGAAHCVQMIHESTLGIYDGHDFEFELPRRDDSSDLGDSSGMSSAADQPPPARPTRRQRLEDDADAVFDIREAHTDMVDEAIEWHKTRRKYVEEHGPDLSDDDPYDTNRKDFILMEFVPHGNLAHMIYGLVDNNERVPNRVLWSFWLCLIKACIALEYPVRKFHPMRYGDPRWDPTNPPSSTKAGKSTWKAIGDDLFEDVPPPSRRWAGKRMVHFDIDPRNILIGGLDPTAEDGEHTLIPRLKLADFGFAERIKPDKINAYYMNRRGTGKYGYFTPEQFARDWDYVEQPIEDGPEISEQRVAGAYGSPTNVYGIALVLWILMTLCSPPLPPRQNPVDPNNPDEPVHYAPLILDDPQFNYIDPELRITISHCLRHYPDERPLLADLLGQARRGTSKEFPGESDDVIRDWVQRK